MGTLLRYLTLPSQITDFERAYLRKLHRVTLIFFFLHVPAMAAVAVVAGTDVVRALLFTSLVAMGPWLASRAFENPRAIAKVHAVAAMCMGGLLVHFGQGAMQIEMHFYFFVLIALLAVFGDPQVILVAAGTVVVHHLLLYFLLPRSVFNYEASFWAIVVHAIFVVLESVAACFVARSFFDNVIGLEKIVAKRTAEVEQRSHELRLILDNIGQGFLTFDATGVIAPERSAILATWLGPCAKGATIWDYLATKDPTAAARFRFGWEAVIEDFLPRELTLAQMPTRLEIDGRPFELSYRPVGSDGAAAPMLLILSDITYRVSSEQRAQELGEISSLLDKLTKDRNGFADFLAETRALMAEVVDETTTLATRRRAIHTLKGNCGFFGLGSVATICHEIEGAFEDGRQTIAAADSARLVARWEALTTRLLTLGETRVVGRLDISERDYYELVAKVRAGRSSAPEILSALICLPTESTEVHLGRLAEQARTLAERMHKGNLTVAVESNGLRIQREGWSGFWSSMTHVIRNAVDHGIEAPDARAAGGKGEQGQLVLRTSVDGDDFVCEVRDDGNGIDWEQVRERARLRGLPHATQGELEAALFADGLSTKDYQTEVSGRGIGMGAVRATCEELGGHIRIESKPGKGTRIELRVPRTKMNALATLAA